MGEVRMSTIEDPAEPDAIPPALREVPQPRTRFSTEDHDRAKALLTANKWIVRRTETINLRDDTQVGRRVAVDYYVPKSAARDGRAPTHLPLMLVRKVAPVSN